MLHIGFSLLLCSCPCDDHTICMGTRCASICESCSSGGCCQQNEGCLMIFFRWTWKCGALISHDSIEIDVDHHQRQRASLGDPAVVGKRSPSSLLSRTELSELVYSDWMVRIMPFSVLNFHIMRARAHKHTLLNRPFNVGEREKNNAIKNFPRKSFIHSVMY